MNAAALRRHGRLTATLMTRLGFALLLATVLSITVLAAAESPKIPEPAIKLDVKSRLITAFQLSEPGKKLFGALEFRGGIEITSSYNQFGGFSSIRVRPDGERFIAVSDKGRWFRGRIAYDDGGRPTGITDAEMAPILGPDGRTLAARGWYDTESIAEDGGTVWLGIERANRIVRFDFGKDGMMARGQPVPVPLGVSKLPHNKGLECLVFAPKGMPLAGTLIGVSERGLDPANNIKAFLIGGPSAGEFSVKRSEDFDVSDCAISPRGDLVLLERKFSWARGLYVQIRSVPLATVKPGATVDGPVIFSADFGHQIDNMEGISLHRGASGETVVTMISDDNFSSLQRTILLQFTLIEDVPAQTRKQ